MTSNIIFLRDYVALRDRARVHPHDDTRALFIRSNGRFEVRHGGHPQGRARPTLTAAWHSNPASGRLECHWATDARGADTSGADATGTTDESACCDDRTPHRTVPLRSAAQAA